MDMDDWDDFISTYSHRQTKCSCQQLVRSSRVLSVDVRRRMLCPIVDESVPKVVVAQKFLDYAPRALFVMRITNSVVLHTQPDQEHILVPEFAAPRHRSLHRAKCQLHQAMRASSATTSSWI